MNTARGRYPEPDAHEAHRVLAPTEDELKRARMMASWAAARIPHGPAVGALRGVHGYGMREDLALAIALIVRRVNEEHEHG